MSTLRMAAIALVTTPLYLLLSVWGEGGFAPFFSKPAVVAVAAITLVAGLASVFTQGNLSTGEREDKTNRWVLLRPDPPGPARRLPAGPVRPRRLVALIDGEAVRWAGVALYAVGTVLRIVPVFILGRRFSGLVAIQPGHSLVTGGLYSRIRNPSYLGLIVLTLGWGLAFDAWVGVLPFAVLNDPAAGRRAGLRGADAGEPKFGDEFAAWRARTWRLIPGVY